MKRLVIVCLLLLCVGLSARVSLQSATRIEVNATYDSLVDPVLRGRMDQYQRQLSDAVNRPIGTSNRLMIASAPESLLSNLLSDMLLSQANTLSDQPMDVAILNLGGIRAPLKEGPITVGDIYKIMPFENELVLLTLKGSDLKVLFDHLAASGGEGLAGATLDIKAGKAVRVLIGGQPLDEAKLYRIATMDYLAAGNSGMKAFLKAVKRTDTHQKVRDCYIEQIERLTAAGKALDAKLDGRIRVLAD
jgi:2',3'-cyclic-nucleotide 2'-phosphodiesterase (5'-nucleotidase family)